jgi:hypothetical protein
LVGRRVLTIGDLVRPGDYCGPIETQVHADGRTELRMYFLAPNTLPHDTGRYTGLACIAFPPHTYRECSDGSLEVRASILCYEAGHRHPPWHGYLDEGHVWRTC